MSFITLGSCNTNSCLYKSSFTIFKVGEWRYHRSLDKFTAKFKDRLGQPYILYTKDVMEKDGIIHLPLYMAMFL